MMEAAHKYPGPQFVEPVHDEYLYTGWKVDPPSHAPFVRGSARRKEFIEQCRGVVRAIEAVDGVTDARLLEAVLIPPLEGIPRYDVTLLVRASTPEVLTRVRNAEALRALDADFTMSARNIRRIGDTERPGDVDRSVTFLLNHFTAPDTDAAVAAWEQVAAWYLAKVGIDNSTLLQPTGDVPYSFINYVRMPGGGVSFLLNQFTRPSFHRFVRGTLKENGMVALPVMFKLA